MYPSKNPWMSMPSLHARFIYRALSVVLAFLILYELLKLQQPYPEWLVHLKQTTPNPCGLTSLGDLDEILVILKTGANEAPEKLPAHFNTTLRCVPHYAVYSDLEETVEGHHVYNALDEVNPEIRTTHPDFEYYQQLQEKGRKAFSEAQLAEWLSATNTVTGRDSPGWRLDKWKFLPMAEKALRHRPEAKWYVFIEADTYIIWRNIIKWLSHFDSSKPHYLGLQMQAGDTIFAYGGAGFILSNPALEAVVEHRNSSLDFYDDYTAKHWAGDCVLGKALKDSGVSLSWSWPTLLSHNPANMNFEEAFGGNKDKRLWCHYAGTYHHLSPKEVVQFSDFERRWNSEVSAHPQTARIRTNRAYKNTATLRHNDVFRHYILPQIEPEHADWDNMSDIEQDSDSSLEGCRKTCQSQSDCVQFSLTGRACRTATVVKLGHQRIPTPDEERVVSGWMVDRVNDFVRRMDASCKNEKWAIP